MVTPSHVPVPQSVGVCRAQGQGRMADRGQSGFLSLEVTIINLYDDALLSILSRSASRESDHEHKRKRKNINRKARNMSYVMQ